jgi:type II secretory pathway pseudopilin PulG
VIVILGILLAIAIPALTGYIQKAQDEELKMKARDAVTAVRAVIDEGYADGTFGAYLPDSGPYSDYLSNGLSDLAGNRKIFNVGIVSRYDENGVKGTMGSSSMNRMYYRKAAQLMSSTYPSVETGAGSEGKWVLELTAPKTADYTIFSAPAWWWVYFPDGEETGNPMIVVTYGLQDFTGNPSTYIELRAASTNTVCNPDAGYKVFHLTFTGWS